MLGWIFWVSQGNSIGIVILIPPPGMGKRLIYMNSVCSTGLFMWNKYISLDYFYHYSQFYKFHLIIVKKKLITTLIIP